MQVSGQVVDQSNGKPISGVTIWEIVPDGQSAQVIGFSGTDGRYIVNVNNTSSQLNFVQDGYAGLNIAAGQALLSDQVLLAKDAGLTAHFTLTGLPAWFWVLLAGFGIYGLTHKEKRKH